VRRRPRQADVRVFFAVNRFRNDTIESSVESLHRSIGTRFIDRCSQFFNLQQATNLRHQVTIELLGVICQHRQWDTKPAHELQQLPLCYEPESILPIS